MLSLAVISLIALVLVFVICAFIPINVGTLAFAFTFIIGIVIGGLKLPQVLAGFPIDLFVLLAGISYLFAIAQLNGTMSRITSASLKIIRGNVALIPWAFHIVAIFISALGAGPAVTTTLLAPIAMQVAAGANISPLLVGLMLVHGSHGGSYFPLSPMGVIANGAVAQSGLPDLTWTLFFNSLIFNVLIAIAIYFLFGGLKLVRRSREEVMSDELKGLMETDAEKPLTFNQIATLIGIVALFVMGLGFKYHVGFSAFTIGVVLTLLSPSEERKAVEQMAWSTIVMITGILTLVGLMAEIGAIDLIASGIAQVSTPLTAPLLMSAAGGALSLYSATGAVLAALIPMVPSILEAVGGGNAVGAVSSLVIASSVVDSSPLSIQGAMLLASVKNMDKNVFFKRLLVWGLAMIIVGSVLSWLIFVVLNIP